MIITTTETIPGSTIKEVLGVFEGDFLMSKNIGSDTKRMVEEAKKLGADAIIGMRYGSSAIMASASEILAYGTAVKLK